MTVEQRASQIWPVLVWAALHRQTLTYYQLSKLTGHATLGIGQCLEPITAYCTANRLPPLTVIVVNQETGLPGAAIADVNIESAAAVGSAQAKVYAFDWLEVLAPTQAQFRGAKVLNSMDASADNGE